MFGAINEIDIFLRTVEHFRQKEVDDEIKKLRLVGPMVKESKVGKFFNNLNEGIVGLRLKSK